MNIEKGLYYSLIMSLIGADKCFSPYRLPVSLIEGIYDSIYNYMPEGSNINHREFIFSMRWVLADIFGDGCEVEEPEGMWEFLKKKKEYLKIQFKL